MTRPVLCWCLAPLLAVLVHLAFGSKLSRAETASKQRQAAVEIEQQGKYDEAARLYQNAKQAAHPSDFPLRARLAVDIARTAILSGAPLEGSQQMEQLLDILKKQRPRLSIEEEAKATRALGLYFAAYALRLDSPAPEAWNREAEDARRLFLELHDSAKAQSRSGDTLFYGRNLEASITLARLRQAELASAPTPAPVLAALETGIAAKKARIESSP